MKYVAPLALGVAGGFLGGLFTVGAFSATGLSIGLLVGGSLFGPQAQIPKTSPLDIQFSKVEYGGGRPRHYGRNRVGGTWIDAPDDGATIVKTVKKSVKTGLFSKQTVKDYKYFLTGAFGLGQGRVIVDELWCNDVVIYDRAGTNEDERGYELTEVTVGGEVVAELHDTIRIYRGTRKQAPDTALAALHGGKVPAYRGEAYVVFNQFKLKDFDNAIPTITAKIRRIDEDGNVIDDCAQIVILECLAAGIPPEIVSVPHLVGKTIYGASFEGRTPNRDAIEQVSRWHHCGLADVGNRFVSYSRAEPVIHNLTADDVAAYVYEGNSEGLPDDSKTRRSRAAGIELPSQFIVRVADPNYNYEVRPYDSLWNSAQFYNVVTKDLNIVAPRSEAKARAGVWHDELLVGRNGARVTLAIEHIDIAPGDVIRFPVTDDQGNTETVSILVEDQTFSTAGLIECQGSAWDESVYTRERLFDDGDGAVNTDLPNALPEYAIFDTTCYDDAQTVGPGLLAGMSTPAANYWDGGQLSDEWLFDERAVLGSVVNDVPLGNTSTFDDSAEIVVQMIWGELQSADRLDVQEGANLAVIGGVEGARYIRFLNAVEDPDTAGLYTLSGILDGEYGSDYLATVPAGSKFMLITDHNGDSASGVESFEISRSDLYALFYLTPKGAAKPGRESIPEGSEFSFRPQGYNMQPLSPVHVRLERDADGITFHWDARSRLSIDDAYALGGDANMSDRQPNGDFKYRLVLERSGDDYDTTVTSPETHATRVFTNSQINSIFGGIPTTITGKVAQLGNYSGFYREFTLTVPEV